MLDWGAPPKAVTISKVGLLTPCKPTIRYLTWLPSFTLIIADTLIHHLRFLHFDYLTLFSHRTHGPYCLLTRPPTKPPRPLKHPSNPSLSWRRGLHSPSTPVTHHSSPFRPHIATSYPYERAHLRFSLPCLVFLPSCWTLCGTLLHRPLPDLSLRHPPGLVTVASLPRDNRCTSPWCVSYVRIRANNKGTWNCFTLPAGDYLAASAEAASGVNRYTRTIYTPRFAAFAAKDKSLTTYVQLEAFRSLVCTAVTP